MCKPVIICQASLRLAHRRAKNPVRANTVSPNRFNSTLPSLTEEIMSEIAELQQEGDAKRDSESVHDTIEWLPGLLMGDEDSLLAFENESGLDIEEEPLSADLSLDSMPSSTQLVRSTGYDSTCISLLSIAQPRSTTRRPAWPPKRSTPKQRLDLLRAQVERLTQELANLKVAAGLGLTAPVVRVPVAAAGVDTPALTSTPNLHLWEKLAARQLNHRRNVEDENKALRQAIVLQYRRVKHLRQLFAKLTRSDNSSLPFASVLPQATMCSCQISRKVLPTCLPDDESVFETLAVDMDELYAGVGDTFWCAKMNEIEPQGRTSSSSRIDPDAWIIEFRDVHVLPFDFRDTARAVWRLETCRSSPNVCLHCSLFRILQWKS